MGLETETRSHWYREGIEKHETWQYHRENLKRERIQGLSLNTPDFKRLGIFFEVSNKFLFPLEGAAPEMGGTWERAVSQDDVN